mmetsp:Transcript_38846/g.65351  ORF Transcript_38846/g.65351 Transcript_38846/m.65351 type:complete len:205 (+) Transcript_38846:193-807(+)|eukprot:CAMPEP_0198203336 /NCGR_PEP_ID=MMETSP1445-20131203/6612_1 /TAXON_ID=36898 /ORGANISM="Pyramimonas sp., Strain CCMP2087" /LENGTH=204 /DNA_ID=CAMNT_0043874681 /DNA_START=89 /DNA_END=703 /DNA_ORIENTATION=-
MAERRNSGLGQRTGSGLSSEPSDANDSDRRKIERALSSTTGIDEGVAFSGGLWGDKHIAKIKEWFSYLDSDADGYLSREELRDLLNQMEFMSPSDRHFQKLLEQADLTDRENVDFSDVMMLVLACSMDVLPEMPSEDHLREALQTFDKGNTGEIDIAELGRTVQKCAYKVSKVDFELLEKKLEADANGNVSMDEFLHLLHLSSK